MAVATPVGPGSGATWNPSRTSRSSRPWLLNLMLTPRTNKENGATPLDSCVCAGTCRRTTCHHTGLTTPGRRPAPGSRRSPSEQTGPGLQHPGRRTWRSHARHHRSGLSPYGGMVETIAARAAHGTEAVLPRLERSCGRRGVKSGNGSAPKSGSSEEARGRPGYRGPASCRGGASVEGWRYRRRCPRGDVDHAARFPAVGAA